MSYLARVYYNASSTSSPYTIPFAYLHQADVHAYLDGIEIDESDLSFPTAGTLAISDAPTSGTLEIRRQTNITTPEHVIPTGTINPTHINDLATQMLYLAQELQDKLTYLDPDQIEEWRDEAVAAASAAAASSGSSGVSLPVEEFMAVPAGTEDVGYRVIVAESATGVFAGKDDYIAVKSADPNTWSFFAPVHNSTVVVNDADGDGTTEQWTYTTGGGWAWSGEATQKAMFEAYAGVPSRAPVSTTEAANETLETEIVAASAARKPLLLRAGSDYRIDDSVGVVSGAWIKHNGARLVAYVDGIDGYTNKTGARVYDVVLENPILYANDDVVAGIAIDMKDWSYSNVYRGKASRDNGATEGFMQFMRLYTSSSYSGGTLYNRAYDLNYSLYHHADAIGIQLDGESSGYRPNQNSVIGMTGDVTLGTKLEISGVHNMFLDVSLEDCAKGYVVKNGGNNAACNLLMHYWAEGISSGVAVEYQAGVTSCVDIFGLHSAGASTITDTDGRSWHIHSNNRTGIGPAFNTKECAYIVERVGTFSTRSAAFQAINTGSGPTYGFAQYSSGSNSLPDVATRSNGRFMLGTGSVETLKMVGLTNGAEIETGMFGFFGTAPTTKQSLTAAISTIADTPARDFATSMKAAVAALGLFTVTGLT